MPSLPNEHWPFRLHTRLRVTSFNVRSSLSFPLGAKVCVYIRGAGPNLVSLSVEAVGNTGRSPDRIEMPNIDTLRGKVDRTTSSWTIDMYISWIAYNRITIELSFPDCQALDAFLFALSYVRLSDFIETRSPSAIPIPLTERRLTQRDLDHFVEMRAALYCAARIAVLPMELLSTIFLFLPDSGGQPPTFGSTLLPLRVCSEWRSVAMGTPSLWRTSPTFTFTSSHFHRGGGFRTLLWFWLERAKSSKIALSIRVFNTLPSEIPHLLGSQPNRFTAVRSLNLICTPPLVEPFLGPAGLAFPSLESLALRVVFGRSSPPTYRSVELCRSTPLLRDVSIVTNIESYDYGIPRRRVLRPAPVNHGFTLAALLPWAQLTNLSMHLRLELSAWMHILVQCTSLETGQFTLFGEEASPPFPLGILTLAYLVSLRLVFHEVRDTRFFDHLALPRLGNLHVEGTLMDAANISFVANYPALRHLTVDLDLFDNGLQNLIQGSTPLHGRDPVAGFQSAGVQWLRTFTIRTCIFTTHKFAAKFVETSVSRIVQMVLLHDCDFKLFGESPLLENFRMALGTAAPLEASIGRTSMERWGSEPIDSDFLTLRKVRTE
ncbi:hypothetical protein C8R46DRAFT_1219290 [Mycena filopes]|nr:hypothetical protein C8R46DRAFT_1219290 [Mycena filopes]